jgi:hypothetical protein
MHVYVGYHANASKIQNNGKCVVKNLSDAHDIINFLNIEIKNIRRVKNPLFISTRHKLEKLVSSVSIHSCPF